MRAHARSCEALEDGVGFINPARGDHERAQLAQVLDLISEDDRLNVYAGELEVRPPGAPTIRT
jgi:hypothetical protein